MVFHHEAKKAMHTIQERLESDDIDGKFTVEIGASVTGISLLFADLGRATSAFALIAAIIFYGLCESFLFFPIAAIVRISYWYLSRIFPHLLLNLCFLNPVFSWRQSDVLTIATQFGTWVLNKHGVTRQLWLSSPISGPTKYNFHANQGGTFASFFFFFRSVFLLHSIQKMWNRQNIRMPERTKQRNLSAVNSSGTKEGTTHDEKPQQST